MTEVDEFNKMNRNVIAEFRTNSGKVGGIFEGFPLVLVHHIGAKSGVERIAPLVYLPVGDRIFIFASKGGAPENPAWYHNLRSNPKVTVEVGTETFDVTVRVVEGAERDEIYAKQVAVAPNFGEYQAKTSRAIPVLELVRAAA